MIRSLLILTLLFKFGFSFMISQNDPSQNLLNRSQTSLLASSQETLLEPSKRDTHYGRNIAQYLVDLHDNKTTFDFCGGMMFQLSLSNKLRDHLTSAANGEDDNNEQQPVIFDSSKFRMSNIDGYAKNADADNVRIFHGRELRQVPDAEGDMGFVLQLSLANGDDPEGWSKEEIQTYDGWGQDSGRTWRKADVYESEGFAKFKSTYGPKAFGLNHRFYLHYDSENRMWLSAEDGCEGTPSTSAPNLFTRFFG